MKPKKRKEYRKSEVRFIESLENVCERILEYNIHKERKDSTRFAKGKFDFAYQSFTIHHSRFFSHQACHKHSKYSTA